MDGPSAGLEVIPRRQIRSPEQRTRYERARKRWQERKAQDADKWVKLGEEFDPLYQLTRIFWLNVETETIGIETKAHVGALVEQNKRELNDSTNRRFGSTGSMTKVASVPMNMLFGPWREAFMENDHQWLNKQLNDPDNQQFRTFRGRL